MWYILKTEFRYNQYLLIFPVLIVSAALVGNVIQEWQHPEKNLDGVKGVITAMTLLIFFFKIARDAKEKRQQRHALLPLRTWQIGFSRLLLFLAVWGGFLSAFWIGSATARPYPVDLVVWHTLSLNGAIITGFTFLFISNDILNTYSGHKLRIVLTAIYAIFIILGYSAIYLFTFSIPYFDILQKIEPMKAEFSNLTSNVSSALVFNGIGLLFIVCSIFTYKKRKIYLAGKEGCGA